MAYLYDEHIYVSIFHVHLPSLDNISSSGGINDRSMYFIHTVNKKC